MFNSLKAGSALATLALLGLAANVHAQTPLVQFNFSGTNSYAPGQGHFTGTFSATTTASGVAAGTALTHGSGYIDDGQSFGGYTVNGGNGDTTNGNIAFDFAHAQYITFTVTPTSGNALTFTSLTGGFTSQNRDRTYYLESSLGNGFGDSQSNVIAQFTGGQASTTADFPPIDLTGLGTQANPVSDPVEFRFYIDSLNPYETKGLAGTSADKSLTLNGAVVPAVMAPEPSQTAALGLGVLGLAGLALTVRKRRSIA